MKKLFVTLFAAMLSASSWAYDAQIDGIYYDFNTETKEATVTYKDEDYNSYSGDIAIPESVENGGVTYSVTCIGEAAFYDCPNLSSIKISNSVTTIEAWTFTKCTGITTLEIPNSVTSIDTRAFQGCTGLTSVTIGTSVNWISYDAFRDCVNVNDLIYAEGSTLIVPTGLTSITSVSIPNSVLRIKDETFYDFINLTSVAIPNSVTNIGTRAFKGCTGLTSIELPNSVTAIGDDCFYDCSGLKSATIPSSLTDFGLTPFGWCTNLTSVKDYAIAPQAVSCEPFCRAASFEDYAFDITVYVPEGSIETYKSAEYWNKYNYAEMTDGIESVNIITTPQNTKHVVNGQVIIEHNSKKYTARGQRVE